MWRRFFAVVFLAMLAFWRVLTAVLRRTGGGPRLVTREILIAGKYSLGNPTEAELYNARHTNPFSQTSNMIQARQYHTATPLNNGKVLITGGRTASSIWDSAEIYDPATNSFSQSGSRMSSPRVFHTATLLNDGSVLIAGGQAVDAGDSLETAELYDPTTDTFTNVGYMRDGLSMHTATLLGNGVVLLVGPRTEGQLYNPANRTFTDTNGSTIVSVRVRHTATLLNDGKVLIAGGANVVTNQILLSNSAELYDPTTDAFTAGGDLSQPRAEHTATRLSNGTILIAGGIDDSGQILQSAEHHYSSPSTFVLIASTMNDVRFRHTATLLDNDQILITGGEGPEGDLQSTEFYDPTSTTFVRNPYNLTQPRSGHTATPIGYL